MPFAKFRRPFFTDRCLHRFFNIFRWPPSDNHSQPTFKEFLWLFLGGYHWHTIDPPSIVTSNCFLPTTNNQLSCTVFPTKATNQPPTTTFCWTSWANSRQPFFHDYRWSTFDKSFSRTTDGQLLTATVVHLIWSLLSSIVIAQPPLLTTFWQLWPTNFPRSILVIVVVQLRWPFFSDCYRSTFVNHFLGVVAGQFSSTIFWWLLSTNIHQTFNNDCCLPTFVDHFLWSLSTNFHRSFQ